VTLIHRNKTIALNASPRRNRKGEYFDPYGLVSLVINDPSGGDVGWSVIHLHFNVHKAHMRPTPTRCTYPFSPAWFSVHVYAYVPAQVVSSQLISYTDFAKEKAIIFRERVSALDPNEFTYPSDLKRECDVLQ
jgi:hypothetical protein